MKGPIQSVEVSYLVQATEDGARLGEAVTGLFGPLGEALSEELEGHFGNKILRVSYHATGQEAGLAFETLLSKMDQGLKRVLRDELPSHLDERSALYLRLDKQEMVLGHLALGESDAIRMRFKLEAKGMEAEAMVRECLT